MSGEAIVFVLQLSAMVLDLLNIYKYRPGNGGLRSLSAFE